MGWRRQSYIGSGDSVQTMPEPGSKKSKLPAQQGLSQKLDDPSRYGTRFVR